MKHTFKEVLKTAGLYFASILSIFLGGIIIIVGFFGICYELLWKNSIAGIFWMALLDLGGMFIGCFGLALFHHLYKDSHKLHLDNFETIAKAKQNSSMFN